MSKSHGNDTRWLVLTERAQGRRRKKNGDDDDDDDEIVTAWVSRAGRSFIMSPFSFFFKNPKLQIRSSGDSHPIHLMTT